VRAFDDLFSSGQRGEVKGSLMIVPSANGEREGCLIFFQEANGGSEGV